MKTDLRTTVLGFACAALRASHVNWAALLQGDRSQLAIAGEAVILALLGFFAKDK